MSESSEYYEQELEKITMSESKDKIGIEDVVFGNLDELNYPTIFYNQDKDILNFEGHLFTGAFLRTCGPEYSNEKAISKQEAAMHLRVPMSGTPWLDEMIEASRRDEFAKAAMQGLLAANAESTKNMNEENVDQIISREAYASADALLAASNKRKVDLEEYKRKWDDLGMDDI